MYNMAARRRWPKYDAVCAYCNKPFKAKMKTTKFCYDDECVQKRYREMLAKKRRKPDAP
jgi:hypothetical protein